ncbi:MAG: sel1 repeat family protein [Deltaproteobacteria bacterium]|nr:sel1 repeat family protein [Deltaproteobacteria bacterium]
MQTCPHCGSANVRKSRRYKAERTLLRPFPAWFRCRECRKRFVGTDWPLARRWAVGAAAVVGVMWAGSVIVPKGGQGRVKSTPAAELPAPSQLSVLDVELTGEALRAAAERGDPQAQHRLGLELLQTFREEGDPAVLAEAVHMLKEAAGRGNPRSQLVLGALYENGRGVIQDFKEAADWYRRAAENGEAEAMLRLGLMAEAGRGMGRDLVESYVWLNLAAARGATEAEIRREAVRRQLTPQQVARGQERCRVLDAAIPHAQTHDPAAAFAPR